MQPDRPTDALPTPAELRERGSLVRALWGPCSGGGEDLWTLDGRFFALAYGDATYGSETGVRELTPDEAARR